MDYNQFDGRVEKTKTTLSIQPNASYRRRNWWLHKPNPAQKNLLINANGRYECPRENCRKTYKEASSLQRHIRCVLNTLHFYVVISSFFCVF